MPRPSQFETRGNDCLCGIVEVWSSNPGECKITKKGVRSKDRVKVREVSRVRADGECVILFVNPPPLPQKKRWKSHLVRKN